MSQEIRDEICGKGHLKIFGKLALSHDIPLEDDAICKGEYEDHLSYQSMIHALWHNTSHAHAIGKSRSFRLVNSDW